MACESRIVLVKFVLQLKINFLLLPMDRVAATSVKCGFFCAHVAAIWLRLVSFQMYLPGFEETFMASACNVLVMPWLLYVLPYLLIVMTIKYMYFTLDVWQWMEPIVSAILIEYIAIAGCVLSYLLGLAMYKLDWLDEEWILLGGLCVILFSWTFLLAVTGIITYRKRIFPKCVLNAKYGCGMCPADNETTGSMHQSLVVFVHH